MTDQVDEAIERLIARENADGLRRGIEERLAVERLVLELGIRAPWLDGSERRRLAEDAAGRAWP